MARLSLPGLSLPGITPDKARASRLATWGPTIAMVVLVALAAWLATRWFWHFWPQQAPPPPPPRAERGPSIAQVAETVAAAQLFGAAAQAPTAVSTISTLNVKLKGVFAGRENQPAAAILNAGQKDEFVRTGTEVVPGVTLDAVFPTHVILKRSGRLERVNLEERAPGDAGAMRPGVPYRRGVPTPQMSIPAPPPGPPPSAPQQAFPPPTPPAAAPVPAFPSNAPNGPTVPGGGMPVQQGAGAGQGAGSNFGSIVPTSAGLTVQDAPPGSVLAGIGLQQGDVIKSMNGQAVSGPADLARLYGQTPNGQTVAGEIIRGGKTVPITITVRR